MLRLIFSQHCANFEMKNPKLSRSAEFAFLRQGLIEIVSAFIDT